MSYPLSPQSLKIRDLRLAPERALNPNAHYTEQKTISIVQAGDMIKVNDTRASNVKLFDTLEKVYGFFRVVDKNSSLESFKFLLDWSNLTAEVWFWKYFWPDQQKLAKYSESACHEVNFFIYMKDRSFFDANIQPYLLNKKEVSQSIRSSNNLTH